MMKKLDNIISNDIDWGKYQDEILEIDNYFKELKKDKRLIKKIQKINIYNQKYDIQYNQSLKGNYAKEKKQIKLKKKTPEFNKLSTYSQKEGKYGRVKC